MAATRPRRTILKDLICGQGPNCLHYHVTNSLISGKSVRVARMLQHSPGLSYCIPDGYLNIMTQAAMLSALAYVAKERASISRHINFILRLLDVHKWYFGERELETLEPSIIS